MGGPLLLSCLGTLLGRGLGFQAGSSEKAGKPRGHYIQ